MTKETKQITQKPIAKLILAEYGGSSEDGNTYSRNQIRVIDMFVAACIYVLGDMSNSKLATICTANLPSERKYTSDNVFQSRKRHRDLINPENAAKYNSHYHKTFERLVMSKSQEELLIKVPASLKKQ